MNVKRCGRLTKQSAHAQPGVKGCDVVLVVAS
jgi:hypothetical protein